MRQKMEKEKQRKFLKKVVLNYCLPVNPEFRYDHVQSIYCFIKKLKLDAKKENIPGGCNVKMDLLRPWVQGVLEMKLKNDQEVLPTLAELIS